MKRRVLGDSGISVPLLSLGSVKFGRQLGLKTPVSNSLPSMRKLQTLLDRARELGLNLLDTAPAYGCSEARIGRLLQDSRQEWLLATKVGEEFAHGKSHFDFSAAHTRVSVNRSLKRLHTDYIDLILLHSNGEDEIQLLNSGAMQVLQEMKSAGAIRAIGISHKTAEGGLAATSQCDVIMTPYLPQDASMLEVISSAEEAGCGVLLKKVLGSGVAAKHPNDLAMVLSAAAALNGVSSLVVGTVEPQHLEENAIIVAANG